MSLEIAAKSRGPQGRVDARAAVNFTNIWRKKPQNPVLIKSATYNPIKTGYFLGNEKTQKRLRTTHFDSAPQKVLPKLPKSVSYFEKRQISFRNRKSVKTASNQSIQALIALTDNRYRQCLKLHRPPVRKKSTTYGVVHFGILYLVVCRNPTLSRVSTGESTPYGKI
jgi:hypothetical protein